MMSSDEPEMTMVDELAMLREQVALLTGLVFPAIVPFWSPRTCQVCGAKADVIDTRTETRATHRNGEGYCLKHAKELGILDGDHLTKPGPKP